MSTALVEVAKRLKVSSDELTNIVINTVMPSGKQVTNEQFTSFMAVANEYQLNPLTKEIYAFPAKGGGIQPIVSIDGWLKIINSHADFDGLEHEDIISDGRLSAIKCSIFRKSTSRPVTVTEYMSECERPTETWKKWPSRMLRHKATIQAARYAFGLSGIIDPDEAERFEDAGVIEKDITPVNTISQDQLQGLTTYINGNTDLLNKLLTAYKINDLSQLPVGKFEECVNRVKKFVEAQNANN